MTLQELLRKLAEIEAIVGIGTPIEVCMGCEAECCIEDLCSVRLDERDGHKVVILSMEEP